MSDEVATTGTESSPAPAPSAPATSIQAPSAPVGKAPDRKTALAQAFEAAEKKVATSAPVAAAEPAAPVTTPPSDRARDDQGRFAKQGETPVVPTETAAQKKERYRLSGLRPEVAPVWDKFAETPEFEPLLSEIERREKDFHTGIETYKSKAQFGAAMEQALNPYMATIQSLGVQPHVAVQHLMAADHLLRYGGAGDKARALQQLAHQYNIDLADLQQAAAAQPALPPQVAELQREVAGLRQALTSAGQGERLAEIQRFAQGKEHFDAVIEDMAALIETGRAQDLNTAYEMAVWANPMVRERMLAKERSAQAEKERESIRKQQAAAVSVAGAPTPGISGNPSPKDRRALIEAAFDRNRI